MTPFNLVPKAFKIMGLELTCFKNLIFGNYRARRISRSLQAIVSDSWTYKNRVETRSEFYEARLLFRSGVLSRISYASVHFWNVVENYSWIQPYLECVDQLLLKLVHLISFDFLRKKINFRAPFYRLNSVKRVFR